MIFKDKYSAVWVSHSSISDYLRCPRAYYLKNIYRDPKTNHKITLMQPALALGQVMHDVLEDISKLPVADRFKEPLAARFTQKWNRIKGSKGGFQNDEQELLFYNRGVSMIARLNEYPGPLSRKAIKLRQDLPYYWLSEEENIILCGKIDWLEYLEAEDAVRIIDFKTGKFDEDPDSLQLPIYCLLLSNVQNRKVAGIQYWYMERDNEPYDVALPDMDTAKKNVVEIAGRIKLARKLERFVCKQKDGCPACLPLESIIKGSAKLIGTDNYNQDVYVLTG